MQGQSLPTVLNRLYSNRKSLTTKLITSCLKGDSENYIKAMLKNCCLN